jgi:Transposase
MPDPVAGEVTAVGIDDFAFRRGHVYGTIVIDIGSHRPLEVLPDRAADTVAAWLKQHPGVQVVCRDRAGAYAEATRIGAPQAVQVADRWHLWHNLCEVVDKTVTARRGELRPNPQDETDEAPQEEATPVLAESPADAAMVDGRLVVRTRERHAAVQALRERGRSITAISRGLGLDRRTARRFVRAEHLLVKARSHGSLLDAFKPSLHERFNAGYTDAAALTVEIAALGYRGSAKTVRRHLQAFRTRLSAGTGAGPAQRSAAHRLADPPTRHAARGRTPAIEGDPRTQRCPIHSTTAGARIRRDAHRPARRTAGRLDGRHSDHRRSRPTLLRQRPTQRLRRGHRASPWTTAPAP